MQNTSESGGAGPGWLSFLFGRLADWCTHECVCASRCLVCGRVRAMSEEAAGLLQWRMDKKECEATVAAGSRVAPEGLQTPCGYMARTQEMYYSCIGKPRGVLNCVAAARIGSRQ